MPFATAASFKDLGTLIFSHHSLNLKQEILLRRSADVMIEEDDLDAMPLEFLDEQHLIGIAT
jgi:hypothetical protein